MPIGFGNNRGSPKVKEDIDGIVESLELMSNPEFLASYKKAKEQVKKRNFVSWNEL
ncbi:MAG: hypothetical protein Q8R18_02310 [bacterium]|nr:hypothetical protein [bacterium]